MRLYLLKSNPASAQNWVNVDAVSQVTCPSPAGPKTLRLTMSGVSIFDVPDLDDAKNIAEILGITIP
jgi:hypothetical protein